jgi:hypothetical protein
MSTDSAMRWDSAMSRDSAMAYFEKTAAAHAVAPRRLFLRLGGFGYGMFCFSDPALRNWDPSLHH